MITKKQRMKKSIIKVGTKTYLIKIFWGILIFSIVLSVYNNFTARDTHTIFETKEVDKQVTDTNSIENYVVSFAKIYFTWDNSQSNINKRTEALKNFLSKELQELNKDAIRSDIPTKATVQAVEIWDIQENDKNNFSVLFSVQQMINKGNDKKAIITAYTTTVYVDEKKDMLIVKNPTIGTLPKTSKKQPQAIESDSSITAKQQTEIEEFLTTFFTLYPSADEKELSYYIKENTLIPIQKNYIFSELSNPIYRTLNGTIHVNVTITYLDNVTMMPQFAQYELQLAKNTNWQIIGLKK